MGQAVVLPARINEPSSLGSADDLLSQLASEEIDRLLSEHELDDRPPADGKAPDVSEVNLGALAKEAASESVANLESLPPPKPVAASETPQTEREPERSTGAAERAALCDPLPESDSRPQSIPQDWLPVYLKPLEWINAPLAGVPERVRAALGKVAIVTLVNAIALLVYIMLFRH